MALVKEKEEGDGFPVRCCVAAVVVVSFSPGDGGFLSLGWDDDVCISGGSDAGLVVRNVTC